MSTSSKVGYHHGDLRAALLEAAMQMLEEGEEFSLRAVARRAGVSPTAPYRHFADREALESALATEGFRDLKARLTEGRALPSTASELGELGVAYVHFALERPALFRLMFGKPCDDKSDQRVQAASELHDLLAHVLASIFPHVDAPSLATAAWGLVHGLAFLHLDGKLSPTPREDVGNRVRAAFDALLSANEPRR
ncbi:WHG domain-containing protein [Myxococcus stipitatus]|uniref:TetR/AcrR family transcriptional regulator n=1 Tax=Myxococcus stipitatus TaxID=83455 RepID=UPI0031455CA0